MLPWNFKLDAKSARALNIPFSEVPIRCLENRIVTSTNEIGIETENGEIQIEMVHCAQNGDKDEEKLIVQKTVIPDQCLVWRLEVQPTCVIDDDNEGAPSL